ncbi:MAG: HAMP domain-containing histidine kinase [Anaerolineae bacterium]|nr:HAMP domain-containing histidine kinase [Anaerolineae bacterium]
MTTSSSSDSPPAPQAELLARIDELEALNRSYMDMLGFVAHEFKNPLATAIVSLYTVKDGYLGTLNPAQGRLLESLALSLEYLQDLVRNYLDLSRLEKGELQINPTYFPLHTRVVEPVIESVDRARERRGMEIVDRVPRDKVVCADAGLLRIVLENLIGNAIKYGLDGGTILVEAHEVDKMLALSVQNESQGIPPEQLPRLFGKFSRLDNPEHTRQRGTGLGLYICKEIIEKHGGQIWAESNMGEWVRFTFTLPDTDEKVKKSHA